MTLGLILCGGGGRMGRAIAALAPEFGAHVSGVLDTGVPPPTAIEGAVVVDFSTPDGALRAVAFALEHGLPLVSGTTGVGAAFESALSGASEKIAVLHATNTSLGVAVVRALVRRAAAALPESFEAEIVEAHHRHKADAPSGTALSLLEEVLAGRASSAHSIVYGRGPESGPRQPRSVGLHSVRGGDTVGDHTVTFFGDGERVEVTHRATDRAVFARGALRAAQWIADRPPGRYTIDDVLGLSG